MTMLEQSPELQATKFLTGQEHGFRIKCGIHVLVFFWIPAFAGMTKNE
jgi:hypothetical protein